MDFKTSPCVESAAFEFIPKGPRLIWGQDCTSLLAREIQRLDSKRSFIVCGRKVASSNWLRAIRTGLGERCVGAFTKVEPHTPLETLLLGVAEARAVSPDCLIAVGGGSAQDAAKLIAFMLAEGDNLEDFRVKWVDRDLHIPSLSKDKISVISIPTTLSAAEVIGAAVYVTGDKRYVIVDPAICPKAVLCDPVIAVTTPVEIFLGTGMNAIAHCVEAIYSRKAQPISDALAMGALRLLVKSLLICAKRPDDLTARQEAQLGACMSGLAYSNTWLGIAHALSQAIGARYRASHGFINSIILSHAMQFNSPVTGVKQEMMAQTMAEITLDGEKVFRAGTASEMIDQLNGHLGLPRRLRDIGISKSELPMIADDGFRVWHTYFNPRRVEGPEELLEVLAGAW